MAKTEIEIITIFKNHITTCGGSHSDWYVGIAQDPVKRLFDDHAVNRQTDAWIYDYACTSDTARNIEKYFVETLGYDGGPGGGDETTNAVYAYKKNYHTNP